MLSCPVCGYENPLDHKYCQQCGATLNPSEENSGFFMADTTVSDPTLITAPARAKFRITHLDWAAVTDVGKQRHQNEDDFYASCQTIASQTKSSTPERIDRGLFVVCDGMGGHAGGEIASAMAVGGIADHFQFFWTDNLPTGEQVVSIVRAVNQSIFLQNEQNSRQDYGRMGTTLVMMALYNTQVVLAHVGDSRIYRITNQPRPQCEQMTRDHEVGNRLIDQGVPPEVAWTRHDAHQLTQALGPNDSHRIEPAISAFEVEESCLFLLCSDGLCDNGFVENYWKTHLLSLLDRGYHLQDSLQDVVDLCNNEVNGHDNLTAILVRCLVENDSDDLES